jgi:hypothetical protein
MVTIVGSIASIIGLGLAVRQYAPDHWQEVKGLVLGKKPTERQVTMFFGAVKRNDRNMIALLMEKHGISPNIRNERGWTPLMVATHRGLYSVVKQLLTAGAEVNAKTPKGQTALDIAQDRGEHSIAKVLLANGGKFGAEEP